MKIKKSNNNPYGEIYLTTNLITNQIYIGQTTRITNTKYLGSGTKLISDFKKYGKENFVKKSIELCYSKNDLNVRERYWILFYKTQNPTLVYNIHRGGQGRDTRNTRLMNDGIFQYYFREECINEKLETGFVFGALQTSKIKNSISTIKTWKSKPKLKILQSKLQSTKNYIMWNDINSKFNSDNWKNKQSKIQKELICITKAGINTRVHSNVINEFLLDGWALGWSKESSDRKSIANLGLVIMNDGNKNYRVKPIDIPSKLELGWQYKYIKKSKDTLIL